MPSHALFVRRLPALAACAVLALGLAACGSDNGITPDTTTQTVTTALPTQNFARIGVGEVAFAEVTINGTGVLTSTADWTFATNDLDIIVTTATCTAQTALEINQRCSIVGVTTAVTTKPERLTVDVIRGNYRVWVVNFGPGTESGTLQMSATVSR